jgi:hypothetical protein
MMAGLIARHRDAARAIGALAIVVGAIGILLILGLWPWGLGASGGKPSPATVATLRKLPEDHLFFSGSSTIGETDYSATGVDSGGAAPYTGWIMGTSASQADVLSFYQQQLSHRGWQRDEADVIRGTGETLVAGWQKQRYIFRLGFSRPGDPRNPGHGAYPTVYSISISTKS